jgi:hypothetical protein
MHQFLKIIYFERTLYVFRTVFPSIIRSSRLYIQQQVYVKQILASRQQYLFDIYLLLVVVGLVWSHDPKSYAGGSVCYW